MFRLDTNWHDCDFTGTIKKYDSEPQKSCEQIEIIDDYDKRNEFGSRVRIVRSRFNKEEA